MIESMRFIRPFKEHSLIWTAAFWVQTVQDEWAGISWVDVRYCEDSSKHLDLFCLLTLLVCDVTSPPPSLRVQFGGEGWLNQTFINYPHGSPTALNRLWTFTSNEDTNNSQSWKYFPLYLGSIAVPLRLIEVNRFSVDGWRAVGSVQCNNKMQWNAFLLYKVSIYIYLHIVSKTSLLFAFNNWTTSIEQPSSALDGHVNM